MTTDSPPSSRPGNPKDSDFHTHDWDSVLKALETTPQGLSGSEAQARLERFGLNRLPEPQRQSPVIRFFLQFHNLLIYILLAAAVATLFLEHYVDAGVIFTVVLVNAIIGYLQEGKAEKAMEAIRRILAAHAAVIRDGHRLTVAGELLVPGDIVLLEAGDKVPADLRLMTAHGLRIQESVLTGESVPVDKDSGSSALDSPLGDRSGMAFSGTMVASGSGRGVVVATGGETEIGRINTLLSDIESLTTPLLQKIEHFARILSLIIIGFAAFVLFYGYYIQNMPFTDIFLAVVGLAVAAIPEGLPAILTVTMALGVQTMARRNAIVRRLPAVETLGSVTVICTDKTGTLTRNEMSVGSVLVEDRTFNVTGTGYTPEGSISGGEEDGDMSALHALARAAVLCNDSALRDDPETGWHVEGDPMEGALLAFAARAGLDPETQRAEWTRLDAIPFDSAHKFMASLSKRTQDGHVQIFLKGAPEKILEMSDLDPEDRTLWQSRAVMIAEQGQRVLGFAVKDVPADMSLLDPEDLSAGVRFLGLTGLIDPPRTESIQAVADCHTAGIRVKMITGDHHVTASAIARQIGLRNSEDVLTGADLDAMDEEALRQAVLDVDVFARTTPEHKLRLVMALQAQGAVTAMTGDGVNDAPALKRADIGIAMGQKGSEAAREASRMVLADDNFATIAEAVRTGRMVYDNITKVIRWTLPTNGGETMAIVLAIFLGLTLPITPVQILWVNMITAVTLGISLAFERAEEGSMRKPPRPPSEPIIPAFFLWQILFVSLLMAAGVYAIFFGFLESGRDVETARTLAVNALVVMQIFYLFSARYTYGSSMTWEGIRGTRAVWIAIAIAVSAQVCLTYVPFFQNVFGTRAISVGEGLAVISVGVALFIIVEIKKAVALWLTSRRAQPSVSSP